MSPGAFREGAIREVDASRCRARAHAYAGIVAALLVLALTFAPRAAHAQTVSGIVGNVLRVTDTTPAQNADTVYPHPGGVGDAVINYADCEHDLSYEFTLGVSGNPGSQYTLEAWVGPVDCTAAAARTPGSATCWPLASPESGPVQRQATTDAGVSTTFAVRMQDIAQYAGSSATIDTTYANPAGPSACAVQANAQLQAPSQLSIYFFYVDKIGVGNAVGYAQAYPVTVDTTTQNVTGDYSIADTLDSQLTVNITASPWSDTVSYNIYCDPMPGKEPVLTSVPYDAATNNGMCDGAAAADVGSTSVDSSLASGPSMNGIFPDIADGAPDDSSTVPGEDAAAEDAALQDAAIADSSADTGASSKTDASSGSTSPGMYDDAGGNSCGANLNGAGIPGNSTCSGSILQSGGGTTTTTTTTGIDDAGDEATVKSTVTVGGTDTLKDFSANRCGVATTANPSFTITGLRDGYSYTIAVAAVDTAGNVGPLAPTCQTVEQLGDFWYAYSAAGGGAGGGYCSTATPVGVAVPAGTSGLAMLTIASVVSVARKRRRRR